MFIEQIVFYLFAATLIGSSLMVIIAGHPVRSALYLVLAFFAAAGLWVLLEATFLALVLIFVYVGAVTTLFLFVIMMLNINLATLKRQAWRYAPVAFIMVLLLMAMMIMLVGPQHFGLAQFAAPLHEPASYSNVKALGDVLYTHYLYPFEIAGVLLLVAIISAITLTFRGSQSRRGQVIPEQVKTKRNDKIRLVNMPSHKDKP